MSNTEEDVYDYSWYSEVSEDKEVPAVTTGKPAEQIEYSWYSVIYSDDTRVYESSVGFYSTASDSDNDSEHICDAKVQVAESPMKRSRGEIFWPTCRPRLRRTVSAPNILQRTR